MTMGASTVSTPAGDLLALEAAPQPKIQGIQQEREKGRPGHGQREGHENQHQRITQNRRDRQGKNP